MFNPEIWVRYYLNIKTDFFTRLVSTLAMCACAILNVRLKIIEHIKI